MMTPEQIKEEAKDWTLAPDEALILKNGQVQVIRYKNDDGKVMPFCLSMNNVVAVGPQNWIETE